MTDTFDPTKPVQLRNGWKAGIYSTNNGGAFPIHGWYEMHGGNRFVTSWTAKGRNAIGSEQGTDLINIPPEPKYDEPPKEIKMVQFVQDNEVGASGVYRLMEVVAMKQLCEHRILRYVLAEGQG